ncbi:prefoldin subunit alpha [Nitrosopumilus sp. b1]|uniref:prefoldin subunit alpha n=1 Tax=Nitrosopumilus sp. b1 TaxID=2109907 RepID=UPI000E2C3B5C|nr:prefoldin subunit alpha [Nitrosopumilus sp. b1]RDJ31581.1 MAG: prefoldin subunit alpha [Thermoproteota archaeon]KAF6243313.1 prefoldin subunit alpha [Nitrosopumilus sp. b1]RDJ33623.1 MAG: prefoldin subunit alpha [Thermoproteota archaeon]RDJ38054.1 MAG: prefoldin subunit alpha [Thermoproteota archaeon]RDJ39177.1 MAG: prefoldin subunit alpha [Thermoproteota archaeon]
MSEEQAQQLLYQLQMLEGYVGDLAHRENTLVTVLQEAISATESLKELKTKPDASSLVPVGLGTFVKSKISSNEKVVLNIGAGVAVEKDTDSAINYLEARIKEIEVALQDASAKKRDAEARLEHGKQQINQMMQSSRSPPQ